MFDFFQSSRARSEPIHLYRVEYGAVSTTTIRLTDAEQDVVFSGETFSKSQIRHGNITASGTLDKSQVEINVPRNNPLVELFRAYPPEGTVNLTIFRGERNDPDADFKMLWSGRILNFAMEVNEAKLAAEPVSTSVRRPGLRRTYQYGCPHALYGPWCKASKAAGTTVTSAVSVSGNTVTLAPGWNGSWSPDKYIKGIAEWTSISGVSVSRSILQISINPDGSANLLLNGTPGGLSPGMTVSAVVGCARTMVDCETIHANIANFGGQPWITKDNPLGSQNNYY